MVAVPVPLLEARSISKSFPGVRALRNVSFDVRAGEVHALLGENGAGKSTLMHIIAGVYAADEGEIALDGRTMHFASPQEAQAAGIAMVFQERSLAGPLSVAENIYFGRQPSNRFGIVDTREMHEAAARLLADIGQIIPPSRAVEELSPAEQQMVEIAKALSLNVRVLVLDEPTAALTETEINALFAVVDRLKQRGVGIIYISHRMAEIFRICDRMTVLRDGECQGTFTRETATADGLITAMVGRSFAKTARGATPLPGAAALEVNGLSDGRLLHDVSFKVHRGEIVGLAGLAGAGRTELAMSVFGARPITSGSVRIGGAPTQITSPADAIRAGIGYVHEDRKEAGLFLEMSVEENAAIVSADQGGGFLLHDDATAARARDVGRQLQLGDAVWGRPVQQLSGGNQQKVMLSRWLLVRPPVLIVDEPTRGIDVGAKREVHELLQTLAREETAILLISSELPELLNVADRILVLSGGRLAGELSRDEATEESILRLAAKHL